MTRVVVVDPSDPAHAAGIQKITALFDLNDELNSLLGENVRDERLHSVLWRLFRHFAHVFTHALLGHTGGLTQPQLRSTLFQMAVKFGIARPWALTWPVPDAAERRRFRRLLATCRRAYETNPEPPQAWVDAAVADRQRAFDEMMAGFTEAGAQGREEL